MRHQPETEQMMRLLLQKKVAYAELEENARIALSVLGDDGWDVQRMDINMSVSVVTRPVAAPDQTAALQVAELRIAALRMQLINQGPDQWLAVMLGCIVCGVLNWLNLGSWDVVAAAVSIGIWVVAKRYVRRKAAR
jgi:hypothetical protein